jgi:hypothetical protein
MRAVIQINVADSVFQSTYVVGLTRAPRAYDYYGVIQVEDGGSERIVAIPENEVAVQDARYGSGMYAFAPLEQEGGWDSGVLLDLIIARLLTAK